MDNGYRNLAYYSFLLIPLMVLGFWKSYLMHLPKIENDLIVATHLHFAVSSIWILLFITQSFLIRTGKNHLHRKLGRLSFLLFALLLASIVPLYIAQLDSGFFPLIMLTTFDILLLVAFYSLAILNRQNPQVHMRYMIALMVLFAMPAIGRINSYLLGFSFIVNANTAFATAISILLLLLLKDLKAKRNFRPYAIAIGGFAARQLAIYLAYIELI